ncbi:MAG: hypothetical protein ACRCS3_01710 [Paracoccaceae bacterium]
MRNFWQWLKQPDDYAGRPWAALANQSAHIAIGAGLGLLAGFLWALALPAIWEAWQLLRRGAKKADYYADRSFFGAGACIAIIPIWPWLFMCFGLLVAFFTYRWTR